MTHPDAKVLMQRQLNTLVGALNVAVGKLVATSAVTPNVLTAVERRHADMLDYAMKLQQRLDRLGSQPGEAMGLQRETAMFQGDVEALIDAINDELKGVRIGPAVGLSGLGMPEDQVRAWWIYGLGLVGIGAAAWWFFRRPKRHRATPAS